MDFEPLDYSFLKFNLGEKSYKNPVFGLEILAEITENYSPVLKQYWGDVIYDPLKWFKKAQLTAKEYGASFVSLYFNSQEPLEENKIAYLKKCAELVKNVQEELKMPLMIKLGAHAAFDIELAKVLLPELKQAVIISPVQAANYKEILSIASQTPYQHYFVMRTPIDINLTKELNILSIDEGLCPDKILIDPDMGCIGYGIDYGYSIIERLCLARAEGDKTLDMPIVVFAGEESFKAKESKSSDFKSSWGGLDERALCWEISTASALIAAGANIAILWHPETIKILKKEFRGVL